MAAELLASRDTPGSAELALALDQHLAHGARCYAANFGLETCLADGAGTDAFEAGAGDDTIDVRDRRRETIRCGMAGTGIGSPPTATPA